MKKKWDTIEIYSFTTQQYTVYKTVYKSMLCSWNNKINKTQTGPIFINLQSRGKNTVKQAKPVQYEACTISAVEIWRNNELHRSFREGFLEEMSFEH